MPLDVMEVWDESALIIGFQAEQSLHNGTSSGLAMTIQGLSDGVEMKHAGLQRAVTNEFPKSFLPGPVKSIRYRRRAIADVSEKNRGVGLCIHKIRCEGVQIRKLLVGAVFFDD